MIQRTAIFGLSLILTGATAMACSNATLQAALSKDFAKYKTVSVTVDDCVATINGTVTRYTDKVTIDHTARKHGVSSVSNNVVVNAPVVADADLAARLEQKLRRRAKQDISGAFTVTANNGAVTVVGLAHSPMVRDEALRLVASTRGVRDIVDQIKVDALPEAEMMGGQQGTRNPAVMYPPDYVGPITPRIKP
jgi:osmotically-inducible protein OsmY